MRVERLPYVIFYSTRRTL